MQYFNSENIWLHGYLSLAASCFSRGAGGCQGRVVFAPRRTRENTEIKKYKEAFINNRIPHKIQKSYKPQIKAVSTAPEKEVIENFFLEITPFSKSTQTAKQSISAMDSSCNECIKVRIPSKFKSQTIYS